MLALSIIAFLIISSLWDNDRELYAEDEFDDDRVVVYQLPPINEVWLDETEDCGMKKWLCKQHNAAGVLTVTSYLFFVWVLLWSTYMAHAGILYTNLQ